MLGGRGSLAAGGRKLRKNCTDRADNRGARCIGASWNCAGAVRVVAAVGCGLGAWPDMGVAVPALPAPVSQALRPTAPKISNDAAIP